MRFVRATRGGGGERTCRGRAGRPPLTRPFFGRAGGGQDGVTPLDVHAMNRGLAKVVSNSNKWTPNMLPDTDLSTQTLLAMASAKTVAAERAAAERAVAEAKAAAEREAERAATEAKAAAESAAMLAAGELKPCSSASCPRLTPVAGPKKCETCRQISRESKAAAKRARR